MRPRWWWATILARLLRKIGKFNDINACASIIVNSVTLFKGFLCSLRATPLGLLRNIFKVLEVKMVCGVMILLVVMVECSWEQETYHLDLVFEFFNIF